MRRVAFFLLFAAVVCVGPSPRMTAAAESAAWDLSSVLAGDGELRVAGRALDRAALTPLYATRDFAAIWVSHPEREKALIQALGGAADHGLDPTVFAVPKARPEERDLLLTDAFLRYAAALARGRVSSAEIESDWAISVPSFDGAAALERAGEGDVGAVLASLAPTAPGYKRLQEALAEYRAIAAKGGWRTVPEGPTLKFGDRGPTVTALWRRLAVEGYLPAEAASDVFDQSLRDAVKRFQARRGIAVDGEVGHGTYHALNVPASARVEQIRADLERWRELPHQWPASRIEVNVPGATLTVIEHGGSGMTMRAIVGAIDHPTPVLRARMNAVLFNPPWNIPASIAKKEILPHVKRDPKYLERNNYVRVSSGLQQLPGPNNALGRIKFELPNTYDVYLHDTPSHPLFSRVIRTLSHGCIRLEEPRQLAQYVLNGSKTAWGMEDIDQAIDLGDTRRVMLPRSVPVYILYWTAFVDEDGVAQFRDDIYGRDARLIGAMAARDAAERVPVSRDETVANCCHKS
ncbi:MAG TPA: L,D-transpeptidase family protein [Stellaceae bacterium]|nr:L,D-transpeptidase family protein [Stellaceae bacterium]